MSEKRVRRVSVLMGSDSDLPVMAEAVRVLARFEVPYELHVTSAHRSPERTAEIVDTARERGVEVFIVGAGAAAHLAGTVAARSTLPVLGLPLASSDLAGLDSLLSTAQMPAGIPVGCLAIGKAGARNAALFAVAICALVWYAVEYTRAGFALRAVGANPLAAEASGIDTRLAILATMTASGALAGLAASNYVLGYKHYFEIGLGRGAGLRCSRNSWSATVGSRHRCCRAR